MIAPLWGALDIVEANVSALAVSNDIESWRKESETGARQLNRSMEWNKAVR
ncbi:hypothetical protein [Paraburkholderia sp.]|jgi:hypothetical protein|uniref:hypothetical protein n=1 Tax=Paraburkholderia sp. TaxID=1926495 RepID=UPI0026269755|nr:hypothetical protein [Paraburkholderia sp.]